jgi:hypothetical protein
METMRAATAKSEGLQGRSRLLQRTAVNYDSADRQRILPVSVSLASYHVAQGGHPHNYGLLPVGSRSHSRAGTPAD